jgi:hypothetical protein
LSSTPQSEDASLALQVADAALNVINSALESDYVHDPFIDVSSGTYDVDCSAFISYILGLVAQRHLDEISIPSGEVRLLAHDYYTFFSLLPSQPAAGWLPVSALADARRGDLVAWMLTQTLVPGEDTGHVFVVADTPTVGTDGSFAVSVYDSSDIRHDDDSRGDGPDQFATGVGSGVIHLKVGPSGSPTEFQFASGDPFITAPIAIARIQGFSA